MFSPFKLALQADGSLILTEIRTNTSTLLPPETVCAIRYIVSANEALLEQVQIRIETLLESVNDAQDLRGFTGIPHFAQSC